MFSTLSLNFAIVSMTMIFAGAMDDPPARDQADEGPWVMIKLHLLQVNVWGSSSVPLISDLPVVGPLFRVGTEPKATPRGDSGENVGTGRQGSRRTSESGLKPIDGSLDMVVAARDWELRVGELVLHVRGGEIKAVAGAEEGTKPWEIITTPRLIMFVGQSAAVSVGRRIPYMTQRDDGSLVVAPAESWRFDGGPDFRQDEPNFEGVYFSVLVDEAEDEIVSIKELRLKISKLIGRVPIDGVPFDVGRPIMQNTEASMSLRLKPDQTAVIALPRDKNDQPPIFMMLEARLIRR